MANRRYYPPRALQPETITLYATFNHDGGTLILTGKGFASVVRNGAGDYTVTLEDSFVSLFPTAHLSNDTVGGDSIVKNVSASAGTFDVVTFTGAGASGFEPGADPNNFITLVCLCVNTSV